MASRLELETFEPEEPAPESFALDPAELEELKLTAFEQGYAAGWDDAIAAQDAEAAKLRAELGRNLQELAFTYHEARGHVLRALEPLLRDMATKVLPALARDNTARIVLEHLVPVAEELASAPVKVVAHPASLAQIKELLLREADFPLDFAEEPSLGEAQVYLRFRDSELRIDLDGVVEAIRAAISAYFNSNDPEVSNG
ncbi:flagellar biosynthesis protein [Phaeovulum sp. NW3]|uniref:flagellar biosynthesis protein n=1 Tax=Phaeovulum sp. NW3 TaxID=2934933 RepID=UPI002021B598|nr:flagellar biosynthesis protein [Phaeovulum sp. NW3]MCL7466470.1 flagellar biosynthesis protein [Phaeovulum sp. NW3]